MVELYIIYLQYTEATDVEPYDDGLTVEQLNREYIDNDKVSKLYYLNINKVLISINVL